MTDHPKLNADEVYREILETQLRDLLPDDAIIESPDADYLFDFIIFDEVQYLHYTIRSLLDYLPRPSPEDQHLEYKGVSTSIRYIVADYYTTILREYLAKDSKERFELNSVNLRFIKLRRPFEKYLSSSDLYVGDIYE